MQYDDICRQLEALAEEEPWWGSLLSNASAVLYQALEDLNWAGFYLVREGRLALGPFQGKAACIHIEKGRGVCGTAWAREQTQRVEDVHTFPGHIACDSASNSEIVIPLKKAGEVFGLLDIDSPRLGRFTPEDQAGLERVAEILCRAVDLEGVTGHAH